MRSARSSRASSVAARRTSCATRHSAWSTGSSARGGASLPIQTDPPMLGEIGDTQGTYIVGEIDNLTFEYQAYRVPSAMDVRVRSTIPNGLQVSWRSPGNKVWRNLPEDITWSTPCASGSRFELLAVAQEVLPGKVLRIPYRFTH